MVIVFVAVFHCFMCSYCVRVLFSSLDYGIVLSVISSFEITFAEEESAFSWCRGFCKSYTMGCPPVRGDNPRAFASGLSYVQLDNPWYNYFILPTLV